METQTKPTTTECFACEGECGFPTNIEGDSVRCSTCGGRGLLDVARAQDLLEALIEKKHGVTAYDFERGRNGLLRARVPGSHWELLESSYDAMLVETCVRLAGLTIKEATS